MPRCIPARTPRIYMFSRKYMRISPRSIFTILVVRILKLRSCFPLTIPTSCNEVVLLIQGQHCNLITFSIPCLASLAPLSRHIIPANINKIYSYFVIHQSIFPPSSCSHSHSPTPPKTKERHFQPHPTTSSNIPNTSSKIKNVACTKPQTVKAVLISSPTTTPSNNLVSVPKSSLTRFG